MPQSCLLGRELISCKLWTPVLFCGRASKAPRFAQSQSKGGSCKRAQDPREQLHQDVDTRYGWPEFDMFGSMPWCSLAWHGAKELSYSLASKFDPWVYSLFRTKVIFTGLPRKALTLNRQRWTLDTSALLWSCKQGSKIRPKPVQGRIVQEGARPLGTVTPGRRYKIRMAWIWHVWINAMVFARMARSKRIVVQSSV